MSGPNSLPSLVSIRELVSLIASGTGKAAEEAADELSSALVSDPGWWKLTIYAWQPANGNCRLEGDDPRWREVLDTVVAWGRGEISPSNFDGPDDGFFTKTLDHVGFPLLDALPLVRAITESAPVSPRSSSAGKDAWPDWKLKLADYPFLTDEEAAAAVIGVELALLQKKCPPMWEEQEAYDHIRVLIRRSCQDGSLPANATTDSEGLQTWNIRPVDLAHWCNAKGIPYPLPGMGDLLFSITQGPDRPHQEQEAEIQRLRDEIEAKEHELKQVTADRDRLRADILERKSRTMALTIIGGMVLANYDKLDVESGRLNGIQAIHRDLETVGCQVDPKTLSRWIKEAITVVTPPKNPASK